MMRTFAALFLVVSAVLTFSSTARAGLIFCNDSGQEIAISVGYNSSGDEWIAEGWWRAKPQECVAPILGDLPNQYYYYFAESVESSMRWAPAAGSRAATFCIDDAAFTIKDSPNCRRKQAMILADTGKAKRLIVTLSERRTEPKDAALACRGEISKGRDAFAKCWMSGMATDKQRRIMKCYDQTKSYASFALCASNDDLSGDAYRIATCANKYNEARRGDEFIRCIGSGTLSEENARVFQCAINSKGDAGELSKCTISGNLTSEQQRIFRCATQNSNNYVKAGSCVIADQLPPEQAKIANCVMNNKGSYLQMAVCAAGDKLTPEQQAFVTCAVQTGGQPYAFAGCVGTQLTLNELQKCMTDGIGGNGCFGESNTAVKFVSNAWKDVTQGPGPSNDLLGQDGFVARKMRDVENDIRRGPGASNDVVGKDGFICTALFGGC